MGDSATIYDGSILHEGLERGRASGRLHIVDDKLIADAGKTHLEIPLDGVELKLGGASDRLVFFSHASLPGWSVFTSDQKILNDPALASRLDVIRQIGLVRRTKRTARFVLTATLLVIVGLVVTTVALKDFMIQTVVSGIPANWESKLGDVARMQIEASSTLIDDPKTLAALDRLLSPLIDAIGESQYEFEFHVVDDPTLNAFAIPGGQIFLNTGLLLAAESPEEILGVTAHEIGHVTQRHSMRQLVGTAGLYTIVQAFLGDTSGLLAVMVDSGAMLTTQKFSRDHEREADAVAWRYLTAAKVDPAGLLKFFERISKEEEKMGEMAESINSLGFLSTHPATKERIDALNKKLEMLDVQPVSQSNSTLVELQELVRGL